MMISDSGLLFGGHQVAHFRAHRHWDNDASQNF